MLEITRNDDLDGGYNACLGFPAASSDLDTRAQQTTTASMTAASTAPKVGTQVNHRGSGAEVLETDFSLRSAPRPAAAKLADS